MRTGLSAEMIRYNCGDLQSVKMLKRWTKPEKACILWTALTMVRKVLQVLCSYQHHLSAFWEMRFGSGDTMTASMFDLTGKSILVTGGNGGIGLGMASAVAAAGADVCIWGRNPDKNKQAEAALRQYGNNVLALTCDVSDEMQVRDCFETTVRSLGKVDVCFANAGFGWMGTPFHKMDQKEWKSIFDVNIDGVFYTLRAVLDHLVARGNGGAIVVTSSLSARFGMPTGEHYAATKAGVTAMVRGIAVEYARYGIRANAVLPGWIETDMTEPLFRNEAFAQKVKPRIPMRRWGRPEDFGPIAVYFSSDASAFHTGDAVVIDGGYSCF